MKKILVIEDEMHIRALLMQTIETAFEDHIDNEELEVFEGEDGEEGLELARKEKPDMIFSDVMMPRKDGFQVCQNIKEDPELQHIHIILLTAKGQEVDKTKGLSLGAEEYMTKPFNPELIISRIEEILKIKRCG